MSSLTILGDTSGSVALTAATVAGSTAITIAAQSGTLNVGGPTFSAYRSTSQSISTGTWTKVQFNVEDFDTANAFDSVTNYRFQPLVAGYYQLNANVYMSGSALGSAYYVQFYKNGTTIGKYSTLQSSTTTLGDTVMTTNAILYLNGSTDYVEVYGYNNVATSPVFYGGTGGPTTFSGFLARTA